MSYDLKIQNLCDHKINWEKALLGSDYKTISLKYPISASASVSLRINNVVINTDDYTIYYLENNESVVEPKTYIRMKKKIKLYDPFIEVQYVTYIPYCPKCLSVKTIDDIAYSNYGDFITAENELQLVQNVEKYIVTKIESNKFHSWFGTNLHSLLGTKIKDIDDLRASVRDQVNQAIEKLKKIQNQLISSNVKVSNGELFDELISIEVEQTDDPTIVSVIVVFTAKNGQTLEYEQYLQLSVSRERLAR